MDATSLEKKVVFVTAGAGGIGSSIVRLAAKRGAKLVIADLNLPAAEELAQEITHNGNEALALPIDLSTEDLIEQAARAAQQHFGGIDVLCNNAALIVPELASQDQSVETMPTELWDKTFTVNVRGTMMMTRACLPSLIERRGNIVNTVSNLALQGHVVQVAYASSKAAIIQMTRSIAASHGRKGIRCNAVAPGMTMTPGLQAAFPEQMRKLVEDETLREQLGDPDDIAEAIVWLASDAARNITGHCLVADGGLASHVPGYMPFYNAVYGADEA